ncbi:hypothetical protein EON63_22045 [archaeon]|nr:MAG: hypothetical protein EON63_22045 [archaeon]
MHHVYDGEDAFDEDAALHELMHKYGHQTKKADTSTKKGRKRKAPSQDSTHEEDDHPELPHTKEGNVVKTAQVDVEDNRPVAAMLLEMARIYFEHHVVGKGMAYSHAAKSVRECDHKIHNAHEADALSGVGKHITAHIQEYLDTGRVQQLEDMRRGKVKRR